MSAYTTDMSRESILTFEHAGACYIWQIGIIVCLFTDKDNPKNGFHVTTEDIIHKAKQEISLKKINGVRGTGP